MVKILLQPIGIGILSMLAIILIIWPWKDNGLIESREIRLRKVGHEVLLAAGDSTSRVLPIRKINEHAFLILFENPFKFEADTLVKVIHTGLASGNAGEMVEDRYLVSVLNCMGDQIIYGYQMSDQKENTIVPCIGREQPRDCYRIMITFESNFLSPYLLATPILTGLLVFFSLVFFRKNPRKPSPDTKLMEEEKICIGNYVFRFERQILGIGDSNIELSRKETKLLKLFALNPNRILERDRLLKEVWEDEGVFVGRSLDMFVSKLRKKLQNDPSVKIINIHGRGYKLRID